MSDSARANRARRVRRGPRGRPLWRRVVRWLLIATAVVVAIPLVLGAVYRVVPPVSTLMAWDWVSGAPVDRRWVGLEDISPALVRAVLASEDNFYCRHRGVDLGALREALTSDDERVRGASTIAMQTAKNLFLWPSRSLVRKAMEAPLAFYLDLVLGKQRLMEIYLNIAEWGPGIFGVEAAAQRHFGVAARALTPGQAALLATALPNPILRDPAAPGGTHRALAARIAERVATVDPSLRDCLPV